MFNVPVDTNWEKRKKNSK